MAPFGLSLVLFAAAVAGTLIGAVTHKQVLLGISKPAATVLLFAILGELPHDQFGYLVASGIVLSLAAGIALLADGHEALVVGLSLFLVAHLSYGFAFYGVGPGGWLAAPGLVIFGAGSLWLVLRQRHGFDRGLWIPIWAHALSLSCMMGGVFSILAGGARLEVSVTAAAGAILFYFSQVLLPWARARRSSVWVPCVMITLYFGGQLCLVLAARWGIGDKLLP